MNYKCEVCHDSGSKNQTGDYLDCPACDIPMIRKALNDFVKSLGPTHPEDVALAIHQRALAMAPKQEAPAESLPEMTDDLISQWSEGYVFTLKGMPHKMTFSSPRFVQAVRTIIAHLPASVAAPAVANGALTDEQIKEVAIDYASHVADDVYDVTKYDYPEDFFNCVRAIVAAAGPDAALVALIHKAQSILAHHLPPDGPDAKTTISELLGLLDGPESRAALKPYGDV